MDVPSFDTARIVALTGGRAHGRGGAGPITANYQTMARGEWFVALAGDGFDDHVNVPEAARREVAGVIVQRVDVPNYGLACREGTKSDCCLFRRGR